MTSYTCENNHVFVHPAKKTVSMPQIVGLDLEFRDKRKVKLPETVSSIFSTETHVCPECQTIHYKETPQAEPAVENVYIHELGTGAQTELDRLLAEGYIIRSRYAKQYHLEKPKTVEAKP